MSAADSMHVTFGGLTLPAVADEDTGTAASLDPGRDKLLAFFAAVLNSEFGAAWTTVTANLPDGHPFYNTTPVVDTLPDEPDEALMTQRKGVLPLLALHRDGVRTFEWFTTERRKATQSWKLHYVLGPLDAIDRRKFKDFAFAVAPTIERAINQRKHRAYENNAPQFFDYFAEVEMVSDEVGQAAFGGDQATTIFFASEMTLRTVELSGYVENSEESGLEGADFVFGVGGENEILPDAVLAQSDQDPNAP